MVNALLVDYEFCYGCRVCEMVCKKEHDFKGGQSGIELHTIGPRQKADGTWEFTYTPVVTDLCDLCNYRLEEEKLPACVHHCQAKVMEYGSVEDMAKRAAEKSKNVVYTIESSIQL